MNRSKGIALDIDDTLSWTCREWVEHLHETFGNPENLTPQEFVDKYRLVQRAPYLMREDVLVRVRELCVDPAWHADLAVIEDARPALKKIVSMMPVVAYLTARPECMRETTQNWLDKHGFPVAQLVMKPDELPLGNASGWKGRELERLYPHVSAIIDDNPSICDSLSEEYPGTIFLYNHDGSVIDHPRVVPCGDWNDVVEKVKKHYASD